MYEYTAAVATDVASVRLIPAVMDLRYSSIRVNTVLLTNRAVSQDIAVRLGVTAVAVEVGTGG